MLKQKKTPFRGTNQSNIKYDSRRTHILFFALLIVSVILRLAFLSTLYKHDDGDTARDYMIARHIAKLHEFPLVGPNIAIYESVRASPLYYYLLSIPIHIQDSVYSIGVFNIILQSLSIISLYALAFMLFGQATATMTVALLLLNQEIFSQSFYMIQAHFGHFFFNSSYAFLAYGYLHKSLKSTYVSMILFALGCTIAFHGFPAAIGYLLVTLSILKSLQAKPKQIVFGLIGMLCIAMFFYAPMLINVIRAGNTLFLIQEPVYITSLENFPIRIISNIRLAMDDWIHALWLPPILKNIVLGLLICTFTYNLITSKSKESRFALIISLFIVQIAFLAACLHIETNSYQYDAATGLTVLLLAYAVTSTWPQNTLGSISRWLTTACLLLLVIPTYGYVQWQRSQMRQEQSLQNRLSPLYAYLDQQRLQHPDNWNRTFQIAMYNGRVNMYRWKDSVIWNALELHYNKPFVRISNDGYSFATISPNNERFLLICEEYTSIQDALSRCVPPFIADQEGQHYTMETLSDSSPNGYIIFIATIKK